MKFYLLLLGVLFKEIQSFTNGMDSNMIQRFLKEFYNFNSKRGYFKNVFIFGIGRIL